MLRAYLRAFRDEWATLMTGALTIPLTVVAFYVDGKWQRAAFGVFALLCAGIASFRLWAKAHAEVLRLQLVLATTVPRLILGFEPDRGRDDLANDPNFHHEPFFLRNDGGETALNLSILPTHIGNTTVTFSVAANHLVPGAVAGVRVYSDRERVDKNIVALFLWELEKLLRQQTSSPIELMLHVHIKYEDRHNAYETVFNIISGINDGLDGTSQMQPIRVELAKRQDVATQHGG